MHADGRAGRFERYGTRERYVLVTGAVGSSSAPLAIATNSGAMSV
jgi:hypothetical protein